MHRTLIALIISAISIFSPSALRAQINTDQVIQIGRNALYFEDYILSIQYFNRVISAKPYLAQPFLLRAIAKFNLDDVRGAEEDATAAIERNPFIADAYELRGVARQNLGKTRLAIEDYNKALSILPENRGLLYNRALAQESIKDLEGAAATYDTLLRAHPSYEAAYIGRAKLSLAQADTTAALNDLNRAIEINPSKSANAYILRADVLMNHDKDYAGALDDINRAIRQLPRQPGLYVNRAYLRYLLDDYHGAMADYDYALQLDPLNSAALFNRSLLRFEVHDFNHALADLNQVLALNPSDFRALYNRAITLRQLGDYRSALADINKLIETFPDLAAAYFLRSDIKHQLHDATAQRDQDHSIALAKTRIKSADPDSDIANLMQSSKPGELSDSTEFAQELVAARFSQLITVDLPTDPDQAYNNPSIRGRVQDRKTTIEAEPIFTATYYSAPTELRPSGEYLRQIDLVNQTNALNYVLQVTNHEVTPTDPDELNRHFQSIDYYNSYISTHSPRAIDYFGRAMNHMTLHNYSAAADDFNRALKLAPDFALACLMAAVADYRHMQADKAMQTSQSAMLNQASYQKIIAQFNEALRLAPDMAVAAYDAGVVMIEINDFNGAINAFTKAIEINPNFGEAYFNRGFVNLTLGNHAAGIADLSRAGQLGVASSYRLLKQMTM